HAELQEIVERGIRPAMHAHPGHADVADPPAARDLHVGDVNVLGRLAQEEDVQATLIVGADLDVIQPEQGRGADVPAAALVSAIALAHGIWRTSVSVRPSCVSRTM